MNRDRILLAVVLVAAVGAAAFVGAQHDGARAAQPAEAPVAAVATPRAPVAASAALPAATTKASAAPTAAPAVRYPDGSTQPLLNGVRDAVAIAWPPERPFAPVEATVTDGDGVQWYRHADGSWTTTIVDRNEPSRGIGLVYTPAPVRTATLRQ